MALEFSSIAVEDKRSGLSLRFAKKNDLPAIDGSNFITGEYSRGNGSIGFNSADPAIWDSFWRNTVGQEPPGKLPKGAMAVMIAQHCDEDPVELIPEKITRDNKGITVNWNRLHTRDPGGPKDKPSRFAVLILPMKGGNTQFYRDVYAFEERAAEAKRIDEEASVMTKGSKGRITLMPVTKLKKKIEFSAF
jgi:hypothetical protein